MYLRFTEKTRDWILDMNIYSLYKHVKISYSCCEEVSIVSVIFIRQLKMSSNEQRIFEINITAKRLFKNTMKSDVGWPHGAASHHQILCQIWKKKRSKRNKWWKKQEKHRICLRSLIYERHKRVSVGACDCTL